MGRSAGVLVGVIAALLLPGPALAVDPQIAALQVALSAKRFYAGTIDGIAGSATASAVRSLQREAGLTADGSIGPETRALLGPLGRHPFGTRLLKLRRVGWDVSVLQFVLAAHRVSPGTLDGRFGPNTEAAVVRFQRRAGLTPDGIAGPRTIARLCPTPACDSLPRSLLGTLAYHRVRRGDTLSALAERYATTVAELEQANSLTGDLLQVGQRLRIPAFAAEAAWPVEHVSESRVRELVGSFAERAGVQPSLARAVAWMESGFQANVRSSAGAWGVMQVRPETWDYVELVLLGRPVRHDTPGNIRVGTVYLAALLHRYGGDVRLALAAYHQGPEALRRWGVLPSSEQYAAAILALQDRM